MIKTISRSIIILSSLWYEIIAKCNIAGEFAHCDSVDVPAEVYESAKFLSIRNGFHGNFLPQYMFRFSNLQDISIMNCQIKTIRKNTFVDLPATYISLMDNRIEIILPGAFNNLTKLYKLSLDYNAIKTVQAGIFINVSNLSFLYLSDNSINSIEDSALSDLPNLKKLYLGNNNIRSAFISRILDDPSKLATLSLTNNSLKTLSKYMLKGLTNLTLLEVGFNEIEIFEEGTFEQALKLQILKLSNNKIKELDGNIFPREGLPNLQELYLDHNELMYLPPSFFFRLYSLKTITLIGNPWLCSCLNAVSRNLYDSQIKEICYYGYINTGNPVCISDRSERNCLYKYNTALSEKYLQIRNDSITESLRCYP